jgi:uncharacterized OB-fold protein
MSTPLVRPAPVRTAAGEPFWAATAEHRLVLQRCAACGAVQHYPRSACRVCLSTELAWIDAAGTGTVYSFTVVRRPMMPAFREAAPYVYALVDLDEGVRMITNVVGVAVDDVRIGQRVRVVFEAAEDGTMLPLFTPV